MSKTRVSLYRATYDDIPRLMEQAFAQIEFDFDKVTVLVKPNMLGPYPPERHVTTQPAVIRAALDALLARGAKPVVGDNTGISGYGSFLRTAKLTGIADAAGKYLHNIAGDVVSYRLPTLELDIHVSRMVFNADFILNLPVAKTHTLSYITGAVKNTFGYVAGAGKAQIHHAGGSMHGFGVALADIYAIRPPDFTFMDAIVSVGGNGPSSTTLFDLGAVLWGKDGAAVDATFCRFVDVRPELVPHLQEVAARGLGLIAEKTILVEGDNPPQPAKYRMPITYRGPIWRGIGRFFAPLSNLSFTMLNPKPRIDPKICTKCCDCQRMCPEGALDGLPEVDYQKCIRCYCCKEACTYGAIRLGGLVRMLQGRHK